MIGKVLISFWCIAVPVVENGDDYSFISEKLENACGEAIKKCEKQYHACEIKYCGKGNIPSFTECKMFREW